MDAGRRLQGLASWCQAFGAKAYKGPRYDPPPLTCAWSWLFSSEGQPRLSFLIWGLNSEATSSHQPLEQCQHQGWWEVATHCPLPHSQSCQAPNGGLSVPLTLPKNVQRPWNGAKHTAPLCLFHGSRSPSACLRKGGTCQVPCPWPCLTKGLRAGF